VSPALLEVQDLGVDYRSRRAWYRPGASRTRALDSVSLSIKAGAALGIVGESGSGKSTLARAVLRLVRPSSGRILWKGERLDDASGGRLRAIRRELQAVFQDPFGSLDPRMTAGQSIAEALESLEGLRDRRALSSRIADALREVGLDAGIARRYPHQLSGGQCQRVAIARAIVVRPQLLICDEATSALDVSVQAQIVNLLIGLRQRTGIGLLLISHDLAVVRHLCEQIVVLKDGRVVEQADRTTLFATPAHPYTRRLIAAVREPAKDA
jgi:ABC-type microcin C transport system duplicated ATPase subunit YejF